MIKRRGNIKNSIIVYHETLSQSEMFFQPFSLTLIDDMLHNPNYGICFILYLLLLT